MERDLLVRLPTRDHSALLSCHAVGQLGIGRFLSQPLGTAYLIKCAPGRDIDNPIASTEEYRAKRKMIAQTPRPFVLCLVDCGELASHTSTGLLGVNPVLTRRESRRGFGEMGTRGGNSIAFCTICPRCTPRHLAKAAQAGSSWGWPPRQPRRDNKISLCAENEPSHTTCRGQGVQG